MRILSLPEMGLSGSILIAAILLLRAGLLNRLPKRTFPALWGLAILRLLLPLSVASAVSLYALFPAPATEEPAAADPPAFSEPVIAPTPSAAPAPLPKTGTPAVETTPTAIEPLPAETETKAALSPEKILTAVWGGGSVLLLLGFAAVYLRGRREFRMSLPIENDFIAAWERDLPLRRRVAVRRSDRIAAPLTYGIFRPVILLPDPVGTDERTLEHILTHELVHIRRLDAVKKPLCALAVCLHWFNPLVWLLFYFYTRDLELACDEGVVQRLGIGNKTSYAKTLIGMEARKSGFLPFFSHFAGFAAEERIKAIMKLKKTSVIASAAAALLVCGTAGVFLTSAADEPPAETVTEEPQTTARRNEEYKAELETRPTEETDEREWWTAEEYEKWIEEQEKEMESLIGTGSGWYDKEGVFHETTRESVDKAIAEYRKILEAIKSGVRVSKSDGDGVVLMQSFPADGKRTQTTEADAIAQTDFTETPAQEKARIDGLFAEYAPFGLTRDENGKVFFHGKPVRIFLDGVYREYGALMISRYTYLDEEGETDVKTLWAPRENGDGSVDAFGTLLGIEETTELNLADFRPALAAEATVLETETTAAEGNGGSGDRSLAEIFAEYAPFGIVFDESEGNVYRNGALVGVFIDLSETGVFSYQSRNSENRPTIDVRTVYENGTLVGVREATETEKNAALTEEPAENDRYVPRERTDRAVSEALAEQSAAPLPARYMTSAAPYAGQGNSLRYPAPDGTEIFSVADGTVVFSGYAAGYGRTVVVRSADGTCWGYGHLNHDLPAAAVGETVKAGGVIGSVGSSGWTDESALRLFLADGSAFENLAALPFETENPLREMYAISEAFSASGERFVHNGIDFSAKAGTEIYAFADGTVLESGYDDPRGNYLRIDHGNGIETLYAHCETLLVKAGETVKKGEKIASVGCSGYATGYFLHFELQKDGAAIDPMPYLK